jgi:hypothetical protein
MWLKVTSGMGLLTTRIVCAEPAGHRGPHSAGHRRAASGGQTWWTWTNDDRTPRRATGQETR